MGNQSSASGRNSDTVKGSDLDRAIRESKVSDRSSVGTVHGGVAAAAARSPGGGNANAYPTKPRAAFAPATGSNQQRAPQVSAIGGSVSNVTEARISQAFKQFSPSGKPCNRKTFDEALGIAESLGLRRLQGTVLGTFSYFVKLF